MDIPGPSNRLSHQVAGHQNVMSDESGSLVIKPALKSEIAFYQLLASSRRGTSLDALRNLVPEFYGTLKLEGRLSENGTLESDIPEKAALSEAIVLENLAHAFTHPSILDVKLGTVLHSPDALPEKRARMEKQARETTSAETGIRLTGSQTWHDPTQQYIYTPKSYGKSLSASQLPEGLIRFFPSPSDSISSLIPPPTSISPIASASSHPPVSSEAISPPTQTNSKSPTNFSSRSILNSSLLKVLEIVDAHLENIQSIIQRLEMRFVGMSVLIIYEGDPKRLEEALERMEEQLIKPPRGFANSDAEEDDLDDDEDSEDEDGSVSSDDDSVDGTRADARAKLRCPPVKVNLIDFAHTRLTPGEGPDKGVLKGLEALRTLIKGRMEQVRQGLE